MTSSERRQGMRLLRLAKAGDEIACNKLVELIAKHFSYMIRGFNSVDPAFDKSDLTLQFQLGIWQNIRKVDGRGDPLYHLAWRGKLAVASMLTAIKRRRHGTEQWVRDFGQERSVGTLPEGWDPPDNHPEFDPEEAVLVGEQKMLAQGQVEQLLGSRTLTERQMDVVFWMMTDDDALGEGANLRLARKLSMGRGNVSPQMASVHRRTVLKLLSGQEPEKPEYACLRCGRVLRSRGALTQHLNGQSGHRPCVPSPN